MSATGYEFKCPKCGEDRHFTASQINISAFGVEIDTEWGWDYSGKWSESEIDRDAVLTCGECGYQAHREKFEKEEA